MGRWMVVLGAVSALLALPSQAARVGGVPTGRLWTEAKQERVQHERSVLAEVARRAMPAVVSITTLQDERGSDGEEQKGLGSGFVIHSSGLIVTSAHVVDKAREIDVALLGEDGFTEEYKAQLVGQDKGTDFALLKIDARRPLPVLTLGSSSEVGIADWIVVIGNPFGLGHSVSVGVVSFKGRTDVTPSGLNGYFDYIQTDAAINPGNSGGPVLDVHGNVIAIANAVNVSGQGIGFAIPVEVAKTVVPQLARHGEVRRGWVGISVTDLTPEEAKERGSQRRRGVIVSEVLRGSPAEKAGLKVGDIIYALDQDRVLRARGLRWRVANLGEGHAVTIDLERSGKPLSLRLKLTTPPGERTARRKPAAVQKADGKANGKGR